MNRCGAVNRDQKKKGDKDGGRTNEKVNRMRKRQENLRARQQSVRKDTKPLFVLLTATNGVS